MATLSTIPGTADIEHYAGDTLTIKVTAPDSLVTGREWLAQVKASRDATTPDSTFVITPPAQAGDPAYLVLPAAETARLAGTLGVPATVRRQSGFNTIEVRSVLNYKGVWDVQISGANGTDPVTTLAQGSITITLDVSRE